MLQEDVPDTLRAAASRHWRYFIFIWMFPVCLFVVPLLLPGFKDHALAYLFLLIGPVSLACGWIAQKPLRAGQVTKLQTIILTLVIPFGIWGAVVFGFWGLYFLLRVLVR